MSVVKRGAIPRFSAFPGVRRNEVRPRIGLETNAQTFVARVRGSDLSAFRSGQLTRDDAIKRVEVRVF
jgi:hypothetical protein